MSKTVVIAPTWNSIETSEESFALRTFLAPFGLTEDIDVFIASDGTDNEYIDGVFKVHLTAKSKQSDWTAIEVLWTAIQDATQNLPLNSSPQEIYEKFYSSALHYASIQISGIEKALSGLMPERLIVVGAENTELIISLKSKFPDLKIILVPLVFSNFLHRNEIGYRLAFNSVELSDLVVCFSASEQEWISQCINKYSPEFNSLLSKKIELVKLPISVNYLASHSLPYLTPDNYICIVASQNVKFESVELFHNQSNKPALSSILNLLSDSIARMLAEKFDQHNFVHLYEDGYIVYSNGIRVGENSSCTRTDRLRLFANSYLTIDLNVYSTLGKETFEALLFSTPVIALEGTVASEYLRKSNGGLWVNSISELNRGLEFILSQPTTAKILGKQGKAWVENNLIEPNKFIKSVNKLIRF